MLSVKIINDTPTQLKHNEVDVWLYKINDPSKDDFNLLSNDEKKRAERFYFDKHRINFICAHANLRRILSKYTHSPPQEIVFTKNSYGKPEIISSPIKFNLSHSKNTALLAVGLNHDLGIDIEYFSDRSYLGIGQHVFSDIENEELKNLPLNLLPLGFFHLWAQKEAVIKAVGLGMSYPLKKLTMPVLPASNFSIIEPHFGRKFKTLSFMPEIGASACVCVDNNISQINIHEKFKQSPDSNFKGTTGIR